MKYDPGLDGVRALAISAVVIYHAWSLSVPGGWIGVDIFFVLSGFLITRIMVFDVDENGGVDFRRFYIRRSLRLLPAFTVLLLFVLGLTFFMPIAEESILAALRQVRDPVARAFEARQRQAVQRRQVGDLVGDAVKGT